MKNEIILSAVRNIKYMTTIVEAYPDFPIVQVPLAQNGD